MDALVDLGPGAEDNPLAVELAARIRQNLIERPEKAADFRALRGTVFVALTGVGESITLRCDPDLGRLTVHEGQVGVPMVTFCGDTEDLRRLTDVPMMRWLRVPFASPVWARQGPVRVRRSTSPIAPDGERSFEGVRAARPPSRGHEAPPDYLAALTRNSLS